MDALASHGIAYKICPGITAASAAAASAGVSLTLRGLARKLSFVTAHVRAGEPLGLDWAALADPQSTLAVYMGKAAAKELSEQLQAHGLHPQTPVMLIENASLPDECITHTSIARLGATAKLVLGGGPALVLIGEAVRATPANRSFHESGELPQIGVGLKKIPYSAKSFDRVLETPPFLQAQEQGSLLSRGHVLRPCSCFAQHLFQN
jgi:uroporphyrin-III C-methyltransferase